MILSLPVGRLRSASCGNLRTTSDNRPPPANPVDNGVRHLVDNLPNVCSKCTRHADLLGASPTGFKEVDALASDGGQSDDAWRAYAAGGTPMVAVKARVRCA